MRAKATTEPLAYGAHVYAQQQFTAAGSFLTWLDNTDRRPADLAQSDLDTWFSRARPSQRPNDMYADRGRPAHASVG